LFYKKVSNSFNIKRSWSELISTRRSTVLSLPLQLVFPASINRTMRLVTASYFRPSLIFEGKGWNIRLWPRSSGAIALSIRTFSITTFSMRTFSIRTFSIRTFGIRTFSIRTFSITTFRKIYSFTRTQLAAPPHLA
jgi:hypothetical protein